MIDFQHRPPSRVSTRISSNGWLASALAASMLALFAVPARAAIDSWTPFGPGGGVIQSLAVDPGNPAIVYAVAGPDQNAARSTRARMQGSAGRRSPGPACRSSPSIRSIPGRSTPAAAFSCAAGTVARRGPTSRRPPMKVSINVLAVAPGGVVFAGNRRPAAAQRGRRRQLVGRSRRTPSASWLSRWIPPIPGMSTISATATSTRATTGGCTGRRCRNPPRFSASPASLWLPLRRTGSTSCRRAMTRCCAATTAGRVGAWRAAPPRVNGTLSFQVDPRSPDRLYAASCGRGSSPAPTAEAPGGRSPPACLAPSTSAPRMFSLAAGPLPARHPLCRHRRRRRPQPGRRGALADRPRNRPRRRRRPTC